MRTPVAASNTSAGRPAKLAMIITAASAVLASLVPGNAFAASSVPSAEPDGVLVSVRADGTPARHAHTPTVSANGRVVAFRSGNRMIPDEETRGLKSFARDLRAAETQVLDRTVDGLVAPVEDSSGDPVVSGNGRYVAFVSQSQLLADGRDAHNDYDVFLRDLVDGVTTRVSSTKRGNAGNDTSYLNPGSVSRNGRWVVFTSRATNLVDRDDPNPGDVEVFLFDARRGEVSLISATPDGTTGDDDAYDGAISADGRWVAFISSSSDLVPGDDNGHADLFLRDRSTGITELLPVTPYGEPERGLSYEPMLSADGAVVSFNSEVSDEFSSPADVFVYHRATGVTTLISKDLDGNPTDIEIGDSSLSGDGSRIVFASRADDIVAGDTNGTSDVFLVDLADGSTSLVSKTRGGGFLPGWSSYPSISANGRFVAFIYSSHATNENIYRTRLAHH